MTILHIDSSILGDHSVSRSLTAAIVERLTAATGAVVVRRDVFADDLAHATAATLPDAHPLALPADSLDDATAIAARAQSNTILSEFLAADTVVIGAPMYNFAIPSQLKAWFDRILVPGTTFTYSEAGPNGLAKGKRVIVAVSRGGLYGADTPGAAIEHGESYIRGALGFIGITNPEVIVAEGLKISPEHKEKVLQDTSEVIASLAA